MNAILHNAILNGLIIINGSRDIFQAYDSHIKIGCEFHHLEYWKIMYDIIGREYNYTESQIAEYYSYIKFYDSFLKNKWQTK